MDHLYESVNGDLSGLNVCIDCANGASAAVAQQAVSPAGRQVHLPRRRARTAATSTRACGSTHLDNLEKAVVEGGFDCGIAFDGDADRCLACDEKGA